MIRGWADGASKRKLHPQERMIKQHCDSVITDRMAADYRPSAVLVATGASTDTKT